MGSGDETERALPPAADASQAGAHRSAAARLPGAALEAILDALDTLVVVLDDAGRIVTWNDACARLTGLGRDEVAGRDVCDALVREAQPSFLRERPLTGTGPPFFEAVIDDRHGHSRRVRWSFAPAATQTTGEGHPPLFVLGGAIDDGEAPRPAPGVTVFVPLDPASTIGEALRPLARRAGDKGLRLRQTLAPDLPRSLLGDPDRLRMILAELVLNAITATSAGEVTVVVRLLCESDEDAVLEFGVRDTGAGLPPDRLRHLLERRVPGRLSICAGLVHELGGLLQAESTPGHGSTFRFTARLRRPAPPQGTSGKAPRAETRS